MPSCLGVYVENNIIKYAKVSKERENIKVEAYGIKFYDDLDEAIKQIVNETYSYKSPISINISEEQYYYADLFSLLTKSDLEKAINTEFEYFCNENKKNADAMEYKKIITKNIKDRDKLRIIYSYTDKAKIITKLKPFDGFNVKSILPLPISITNLNKFKEKKNSIIVNMEKETTITTIIAGEIYKIDKISDGMKDILDAIIIKENSFAKAYEICKNSTIYTTEGKSLQVEENEYMVDIMPVLYSIVQKVQKTILENGIDISNIYITGLASIINNIDLYFQENFSDKKCELLVPYFTEKTNLKLNIKDYIEVNSAISLALQGLTNSIKDINFKGESTINKMLKILTTDVGGSKSKTKNGKKAVFSNLNTAINITEKGLFKVLIAILIIMISYISCEKYLAKSIDSKSDEIKNLIQDTQTKINNNTKITKIINSKINNYEKLLNNITENNQKLSNNFASKNAIPNLLNNIMAIIPKQVQLTSIENTTDKQIVINAQSEKYEHLGYFKAKLKADNILINVTSTSGIKENGVVKVIIEGTLPY